MDTEIVLWLVVAVVMIIIEIASLGLTSIWFAGGAVVAAIVAYSGLSMTTQIIAFAVVSLLLLIFTRPIAQKHLIKEPEATNVDSFIGTVVDVIETVEGRKPGLVKLNGLEWSAITEDDSCIASGEEVVVKAISGNKLIVEKNKN